MPARLWRAAAAGLLLFCAAAAYAQDAPAPDGEVVLAVRINEGSDELSAVFLRRSGELWARVEDLDAWRIEHAQAAPLKIDGHDYVPLSALPGLKTSLDQATQTIALTVPVDLFVRQQVRGNAATIPKLTRAVPAAFVNYDLAAETQSGNSDVRGFFEAGVSNSAGVAVTTFTANGAFGGATIARLDSYLLHDDPDTATRLTIGDAITAGSAWARPIHFAGVKYGTDFGLRPGYITFPTADFQGRTVLPSSVEFYADGALRYRRDVDRGPFAVDQAPLPSGAGTLTVVTRDVLGVERRTTTPYYVSTNLLRAGLSRYSIEFGAERNDYGLRSFGYSRPFVAGVYRYGLTNRVTVEGRSEIGELVQDAGGSITTALPVLGELTGTFAVSEGGGGFGMLWGAAYSRVSRNWDFGLSLQQTNDAFTQIGIRQPSERILRQIQGNLGHTFGRLGHLGVSIADLRTGDRVETKVVSASYSVNAGRLGYLDAFASFADSRDGTSSTGVGIGLTIPFGPRTTMRVGGEIQSGRVATTLDYREIPPTDRGFGYGAQIRLGAFGQQRADATWLNDAGEFNAEAARVDGASGLRATARGSLVFAENTLFATRPLEGAFGIVDAGGFAGVRVYQDNRPLTRTNAQGRAIIPALRPYEENSIRLSPDDMPIGARVDADDIVLVPSYRAGVTAHFKLKSGHAATIVITTADGTPVPPGAAVSIDGGREKTFAGFDGNVFISDARPEMTFDVDLPAGACRATATMPDSKLDLPQLGPVRCAPGVSSK